MKNYIIMIGAIFLFIFNSCQSPNEPVLNIEGVNVSIKLETFAGEPLSGFEVRYQNSNVPTGNLSLFGSGITNSSGLVTKTMSIPTDSEVFNVKITTNNNPGIPDAYLQKSYTFKFACKDSTYIIRLPLTIKADCEKTLPTINPKKIFICPKVKQKDTVLIGPICLECDSSTNISYNSPQINNASIIITDDSNTILQGNPFNIQPKSCFYINYIFDSKGEIVPATNEIVAFNVNNGKTTYKLVDININAESNCSECECPSNFIVSYPTDSTYFELCLGDKKEISIPLQRFLNTNSKCGLIFELDKQFENSSVFQLLSFNENEYSLLPNSLLKPMKLGIIGSKLGKYNDQIRFKVFSFNPDYNLKEDCNVYLTINVNVEVKDSKCEYDLVSSIFEQKYNNIDSTVTMKSGVGTSDSKSIGVKNPSNCPLIINGYEIDNKMSQGRPFELLDNNGKAIDFPIIINSNSTYYFKVKFKPDTKDAYPPDGVRKNEIVEYFKTKLRFLTSSQECSLNDINLKGQIVTKSSNYSCMLAFNDYLKQGIIFVNDGSIRIDTANFYIYFEKYDPVNKKATIKRTFTSDNKVYVSMVKSPIQAPSNLNGGDVCDLAARNNTLCDEASMSQLNSLDVAVNDIISLTYNYTRVDEDDNILEKIEYCTIIVITKIEYEPVFGAFQICFVTCTGI